MQNNDNRCFGYAVLSALHPQAKHANRPSKYNHLFREHGLHDIEYPVAISQVPMLEDRLQIRINVLTYLDEEGKVRCPIYISRKDYDREVDLLHFANHYAWIKDFPRFMNDMSKDGHRLIFCKRCLAHFKRETAFAMHRLLCARPDFETRCIVTMPAPDSKFSKCKFVHQRNQLRMPFVVYADFECLTVPADILAKNTTSYQQHVAIAAGLVAVSLLDDATYPYCSYTGADPAAWLLDQLLSLEEIFMHYLFNEKPMDPLTEREIRWMRNGKQCHLCKKPFAEDDQRVADHDHITGKFRGPAHNECNLKARTQYKIPVFFHNWRGYDSHIVVSALTRYPDRSVDIIGQTMEKYLTLSWGPHIVFKDSLQFLSASLATLVGNQAKSDPTKFFQLNRYVDNDKVPLLLRKGVFPYDWFNDASRLDELQLPPKEEFVSSLTEEAISDADYAHATRTWDAFQCTSFRDYMETYLKADVLQLADIFESFRDTCLKYYELDPAPYLSTPNFTWDAMLKMTEVELELITDPEMFRMLDQGMRGGISTISHRYAKANNKYMDERYNPAEPTKYIVYLDANNLYGWAMVQPTAYADFEWMSAEEIEVIETELKKAVYTSLEDEQEKGYFFEISADYPRELHDFHNEYPMAPEHMTVNLEMLNPIQATIRSKYNMPRRSEQTKLIPNLKSKKRYVVHYRNLKFYLRHGLMLNKIIRGISFKQSDWIASYIQLNTSLRAKAENDFEKDKLKLFNNSLF